MCLFIIIYIYNDTFCHHTGVVPSLASMGIGPSTHIEAPPSVPNLVWLKFYRGSSVDCSIEMPQNLGIQSLDRNMVAQHIKLIAAAQAAEMNQRYLCIFGSCFVGVCCLVPCFENKFQRKMAEILENFKKALGPGFGLRFVIIQRSQHSRDSQVIVEDAWLGIAHGVEAINFMESVQSNPVTPCACCGASDPELRVL